MAISLNSVVGFSSQLQAKYQRGFRAYAPKTKEFTSSSTICSSRICIKEKRRSFYVALAAKDSLATDTSDSRAADAESTTSPSPADSLQGNRQTGESEPQTSGISNGTAIASDAKQEQRTNSQSKPKTSPLTARQRLKAARVLSRYTETKSAKPEMGRKVLDALRESDKGKKRSGLPEAPTNLFDDSKRGLPKPGWTFQFPGGSELFFIIVSFVLISSIMFATTYIVWKVGAIHFNEY